MRGEPDERASNEEEAESRAYLRIVDALERDKFYVVVRSRASTGWNWAVDVDARTVRGGQAVSKQAAIKAAERLIDGVLAPRGQKLTLVGP